MNWLVVAKTGIDLAALTGRLKALGAETAGASEPIPQGADEQTLEIVGPRDLPALLKGDPDVVNVYPSSEYTLDRS